MANPQVLGPDNVLRTEVIFSTTVESRFILGTLPDDAADAQVSINGSGFSSDPSQIDWGDGQWTVPNPSSEPNGLLLLPGENIIRVRAILPAGTVTPEAIATARLVSESNVGVIAEVPTNIGVDQQGAGVVVRSETLEDNGFQGMNFYASISAGGGVSGYTRINIETVSEGDPVQEVDEFSEFSVDARILVDAEGDPVADPLFFRMTGQQEDEAETVLQVDFNEVFEVPETARDIRITSVLQTIRNVLLYKFDHVRTNGPNSTPATVRVGAFSSLPAETPLYYTVTAVYFDETRNLEYESSFSEEVVGHPTSVSTALTSIPTVRRQTIVQQFITTIFRSNPQIKVETGSALRDTVIDPFSSESERIRFVFDFFQRGRTPDLLLQIDDPNLTGVSIPVSQSAYKQALQVALYLSSAVDVQNIIDSAFEAFASNYGKRRRAGIAAAGGVTFFTSRRPGQTLLIPLGTVVSGGGVQFATIRAASIPFERLASFFDPVSGRYQLSVSVRAVTVGSSGNIGTGQVSTVISALAGSLSVVNTAPMVGGKDLESNLALTIRVKNALASVDSGTARGYLQTAADVAGVIKANVVSAGDELMQRDLDENGIHRGGKVDIWVQGSNVATVTDTFAFTFDIAQDIQFELIGLPSELQFRALDPELSLENPIVEMLDDPTVGFEFRNASTGFVFDLTDVVITSFDAIQLSTAIPQPGVDLTDIVLGSYRRRTGTEFVLPRQPVDTISQVTGTASGEIPSESFLLVHPDAPLGNGRSSLAKDFLRIIPFTDESGDQVPSGDTIPVTDEEHVLIGQNPEFLDSLGANFLTLVVTDSTGTITYKGPNDPSGDPDYTVNLGSATVPISIVRTETGDILSGATVLVDYEHDENFTVTYTTNLIVSLTQNDVDEKKHATADVLAKEAVPIPLDVESTVVLIRGRERSTVDTALRTNLANFFNNLRLGDPVRQSDVIDVIEQTEGVSFVVVPLNKLVPQENSTLVREEISTDTSTESVFLSSLSTSRASVYILTNSLKYATIDGGGPEGFFTAVFQDDSATTLLEATASLVGLGLGSSRSYIIGNDGRSIDGYSDDTTLMTQGFVTPTSIEDRRKELTANHILVSVPVGEAPTLFTYSATYTVGVDSGAKNVDPGNAQYVASGDFLFTLDEDR
jgi:uncharacterized phage protein gp47/JayE